MRTDTTVLQYSFNKSWYDNYRGNRFSGIIRTGKFKNDFNRLYQENIQTINDVECSGVIDIKGYVQATYNGDMPTCLLSKVVREIDRIIQQIAKGVKDIPVIGYELSHAISGISKTVKTAWDDTFGKLGCYITTATMVSLDTTDDDCYELTMMRRLRDEYINVEVDNGPEIINQYYVLAPIIVEAIGDNREEYNRIYNEYLAKCISYCEKDKWQYGYIVYMGMVVDLYEKHLGKELDCEYIRKVKL